MKYSIDTSAILEGWHRRYPPDVFPALWKNLDELIGDGSLRATEEVLHELKRKDDGVFEWARDRPALFVPIDHDIQVEVQEILVTHEKLLDTRSGRSSADPFVIALAKMNACTVVSDEKPTRSPKRPNIPDVCRAMGLHCIDLLDMIREEEWVFSS